MPGLPAAGELSYNGYTFDGATHVSASQEPVYDGSGRSVKYVRHIITVEAVIALGNNEDGDSQRTDEKMEEIRYRLAQPRKTLKFVTKGYGDDIVITNGRGDVDFGPKPHIISWKPIGSNLACEILWSIEVCKLACDSEGKTADRKILEHSFDISFSVNEYGDTTRTISGRLEIILNAAADGTIAETVDDHFNKISVTPLPGFKRTLTRNIASNKKEMTYSITDTQIPSPRPYPNGMIDVSGTHEVSWRRGTQGKKQINSINMTLSPNSALGGAAAWATFVSIVKQRMLLVKQNGGNWPFITDLKAAENLWGRPQSFSCKYWVLGCLSDIVSASGLWTPLDGESWNSWRASITSTAYQNYGSGGHRTSPQWDVVMDMCEEPNIPTITPYGRTRQAISGPSTLSNETPPAESSWMKYNAWVVPKRTRPVARGAILQETDEDDGYVPGGGSDSAFALGETGGTDDILQEGGRSRYSYELHVQAVRAGHDIPRPRVITVNGAPAVEISSWFDLGTLGDYMGVTVQTMNAVIQYGIKYATGEGQGREDKMDCVSIGEIEGGGGDDGGGGAEPPADDAANAPFGADGEWSDAPPDPNDAPMIGGAGWGGPGNPGNAALGNGGGGGFPSDLPDFGQGTPDGDGNWQLDLNTPDPPSMPGPGSDLDAAAGAANDIFNNL